MACPFALMELVQCSCGRKTASPESAGLEQRRAGYLLIRFQILSSRLAHHFSRQLRRFATLVPAGRFQPVAHELLVERRRADADLILIFRPESRAVRSQNFV